MSTPVTSFRFPFNLSGKAHAEVEAAIRYAFSSIKDAHDAINALNTKVGKNVSTVTNITENIAAAASAPSSPVVFGNVNLQPNRTPGAYTLAQSDLGGLILVQSSVPFALTLNSSLMTPFFVTVYNFGTGTVTAAPSAQLVNNTGFVTVTPGQFGIFFFDGTNWWEAFSILAQTINLTPSKWLNSYSAATGLFTASQPAASDLSNGTTGTGAVVLESSLPLVATSASLGGSALTAGQTTKIATSVPGATTSMVAVTSPQTYPGDSFVWDAYVDSPGSVTVALTAILAGTPAASLYNIRVIG